jgi:hydrogenase maturation protease
VTGNQNREPRTERYNYTPLSGHLVTLSSCHPVTLVIGYGNDLRGDDAVGPLAAAAVAAWDAPGVWALAVHQLTPELAEALAVADLAIFVDACASPDREEVETHLIAPAVTDTVLGHTGDPRGLLALTAALYGHCPAAWSITVPARSFAFGAGLSPVAERGLAAALERVRDLIRPFLHPCASEEQRYA